MCFKKIALVLTTLAVMLSCAVPCYAETYNAGIPCVSGVSPLYDLAKDAYSYLNISNTTATCKTTVNGKSNTGTITVVQTLQKHWAFGIYSDVDGAKWTKTVSGDKLTLTESKSGLSSGTYQVKSVVTVTAKDGTSETFTVYSEKKSI